MSDEVLRTCGDRAVLPVQLAFVKVEALAREPYMREDVAGGHNLEMAWSEQCCCEYLCRSPLTPYHSSGRWSILTGSRVNSSGSAVPRPGSSGYPSDFSKPCAYSSSSSSWSASTTFVLRNPQRKKSFTLSRLISVIGASLNHFRMYASGSGIARWHLA